MSDRQKPTVEELDAILNDPNQPNVVVQPDGSCVPADNDARADMAAVELLHAMETPINGVPSVEWKNYGNARRLAKAALLGVFEALNEKELVAKHEVACKLVAEMHAAAVGEVRGPKRGVVEDVAHLRTELGRAYRAIRGMYSAHVAGEKIPQSTLAYHSPTIAAAIRFVDEGALDGSDYFIGKPVDVLHAALALAEKK